MGQDGSLSHGKSDPLMEIENMEAPKRPYLLAIATSLGTALILGLLLFTRTGPLQAQEGLGAAGQFKATKASVSFAAMSYVGSNAGQRVYIAGRDLKSLQLIPSKDANAFWLELFYTNGDYVMQRVTNLTFYQKYENWVVSKVMASMVGRDQMAFPLIR